MNQTIYTLQLLFPIAAFAVVFMYGMAGAMLVRRHGRRLRLGK